MAALLCVLLAAVCAAAGGSQLTLSDCSAPAPAALQWSFSGDETTGAPGAFSLVNSPPAPAPGLCATYDAPTTNMIVAACGAAGAPAQTFSVRSDGTIFSPAENLCWDSQYYANTSGAGVGLYACHPEAGWGRFSYSRAGAGGRLTNTQVDTLCVDGALALPTPTPQQLQWTRYEVALMISYDMITQLPDVPNPQHFCIQAGGDSGFPVPPASAFNPEGLSTDYWMQAAAAADAKYTLLVASHCSGFLQWQSDVKLPDGSPYPYTVRQSAWRGGAGDVVDMYVNSSKKAGLPFGFYLTWNYNYLFNWGPSGFAPTPLQPGQVNISEAGYRATMLATIEEVWSRYPGAITEICACRGSQDERSARAPAGRHGADARYLFPLASLPPGFDGGENNVPMNDLIAKLQPQAIATDGTQAPNYARLVGRESGYAPYPVWSTVNAAASDGSGDPLGRLFCPAEADTPIANEDAWFWKPSTTYRPLAELKAVYRNTVGANSVLELGVLPDNNGVIPADQMAVLQSLGDYIRGCHSPAAAVNRTQGVGASIRLDFPLQVVDRVILQEDLAFGQIVQAFTVAALPAGGYDPEPVPVAQGTAIGNKRILYFASGPIPARAIIVTATALYPGASSANWLNVAAYAPCALE